MRDLAPVRVREGIEDWAPDRGPPLFPIHRAALSKMLGERFSRPREYEVEVATDRIAPVLEEGNDVLMVERSESRLDLELKCL